jgi:hypothetical protein
MEKLFKFFLTIPGVAVATALILSVPLVAMQFTDDVNWSVTDFIIMGALIFGAGMLLAWVMRSVASVIYRGAMVVAIGATFLMIWVNLAVGLIGSGPHWGNLMYAAVVAVLLIGIYLSRFKAAGLERAMYSTAFSFVLLAAIALLAGMQSYPGSSVMEIVGVNLFFATPYIVAGLMFRYVAMEPSTAK